jgi:hypothetical protein
MNSLLSERIKTVQAIVPVNTTADINGLTVDRLGYDHVLMIMHFGTTGDTLSGSVYALAELEDSDDGSAWADVADANIKTAVVGLNTGTFAKIDTNSLDEVRVQCDYLGTKRYVRPVCNLVGTHTNGIEVSALAVLGRPRNLPAV